MTEIGKLNVDDTYFFCCDMQEKFRSIITHFEAITVVVLRLLEAARILSIPVIVTEQYPKGLGQTIPELKIHEYIQHEDSLPIVEKTRFSMALPEIMNKLNEQKRKSVVLFGIEAHVCVLQTALDLRKEGYTVHVIADGVSSRSKVNRIYAIERMRQSGIFVTTYESVLLGLLGDSKAPKFKDVQKLIMQLPPDSGLLPQQ